MTAPAGNAPTAPLSRPAAGGPAGGGRSANAVAPRLPGRAVDDGAPEPFGVVAAREIAASGLFAQGICQFPDCSAYFTTRRDWQLYCCDACRMADQREFRIWGHRMAQAALIWRRTKYARDPAGRALCRAARRYLTQVQSAWEENRRARVERAERARHAG